METIQLTVLAEIEALHPVQSCLRSFCDSFGLYEKDYEKLSLAVEEVFSYCVKLLGVTNRKERITIRFNEGLPYITINMEYRGPTGALEKYFKPGQGKKSFKRDTFDALGLFLANEMLSSLEFSYTRDGGNIFYLTYVVERNSSLIHKSHPLLKHIHWLGEGSFKITGRKLIYLDPYNLKEPDMADIVLITNGRGYHYSIEDIRKVLSTNTRIIAPAGALVDIGIPVQRPVQRIEAGETVVLDGVDITAVGASFYRETTAGALPTKGKEQGQDIEGDSDRMVIDDTSSEVIQRSSLTDATEADSAGAVGYVLQVDEHRMYFSGDSAATQAMTSLKGISAAFLSLKGMFGMTVEEAIDVALSIRPSLAVPVNYYSPLPNNPDTEMFASRLETAMNVFILRHIES